MIVPPPEKVLTVTALTRGLQTTLERTFPDVWVAGEITNFNLHRPSGHMYFALKDATSQIACRFFRGSNLRLRFDLKDGMQVLARGQVSFYTQRGDAYLGVLEVQPKGIGAAELALRQLKEKLRERGYFDPKRKRPLPTHPKRIAIIASAGGAAIRDILEIFTQRWPLAELVVIDSRVQGEGAGRDLSLALRRAAFMHSSGKYRLDAILLGRGGGSSEDLAAFNEEILATAIYNSPVPVVSAVGHETDLTIADLVADHRAETPSAAVVKLTPNIRELEEDLRMKRDRMADAMARRLQIAKQRVDQIAGRPVFRRPLDRFVTLQQRLDDISNRLTRAATVRHSRAADRLAALAARLETLSPLQVLQRGYSLTHLRESRKLVRSAEDVSIGDEIVTRLANGEIVSQVKSV